MSHSHNKRRKFRQKMGLTKLPKRGGELLPTPREWFLYLQKERLAHRPVLGKDAAGKLIYGPSTFRNIINEKGELV